MAGMNFQTRSGAKLAVCGGIIMVKKYIKIIICHRRRIFLAFCLLLLTASLCLFGAADNRQTAIEQDPALYKTVDAEGVFHIYNQKDFKAFLKYVKNGHKELNAVLENDIEVEKSPYWVQYYSGHFDGQGHKIAGMTRELFLLLEKDGIVENLIAEVHMNPYEGADTGGLVYYNCGTVRGCEVYGTVVGYNYVGGIAAISVGLIENCRNYASVTSLEDGRTMEYNHWTDGYGAGGIAGLCATTENEEKIPETCAIIDCENYGNVTGKSYAGGIVAYLDDRTEEMAPASSVEELVQNEDFITPLEQIPENNRDTRSYSPKQETDRIHSEDSGAGNHGSISSQEENAEAAKRHYSLVRCRNYGTVTAENRQDPRTLWYTQAAGICAELHWGSIYECANSGKVCFDESAPKYSEDGYLFTNCPMAITYNLGFAPTEDHHIINCVNLKGTIAETMRHENIMELTEDDMNAWEKGVYQKDYISNNWEFDLQKAVEICGLQPLNVSPNPLMPRTPSKQLSRRANNYYLCDAFAIYLPEYMKIEEVSLSPNDPLGPYALHITVQKNNAQKVNAQTGVGKGDISEYEECWIVRKDADVQAALKAAKESNTRNEWRVRYFLDELFHTVSSYHYMDICSLNLPFHNSFQAKYQNGRRIFVEGSIPDMSLYSYLREGDHMLGNMLVMPLHGFKEPLKEQLKAQWIMVFTMRETNIHPSRDFIDLVEAGFYPLSGTEKTYTVEAGDSLWQLAEDFTLHSENWEMLAALNGIGNPDYIVPGEILIVPSLEEWEKDEIVLSSHMIMEYG